MTDKLTPGQLRDLADLCSVGNCVVTLTANGETTRFYPNKDLSYVLLEEAARREAEARPQNGRGHIPLITCPGSTKSCMGYDCLDKGCLDGEPKTVHTCNFVDSDQVGVFICHGCGRKLMPKGLSVDALRSANISIGGCEVCTTPTGCEQEKHCDHFNMAFYSEREGPDGAADDLPDRLRTAFLSAREIERIRKEAADRIERETARADRLASALKSIAGNTCCTPCREAGLVAARALIEGGKPNG